MSVAFSSTAAVVSNANNFILNPNAEVDTAGWNLYNNSGRTVPASLLEQDLTYTSTLSGDTGNGVNIEYVYNASFPAATPNINVISSTHVQVQWNNGPTIANNPTATQLKAAWDAVGAATAIATVAITGVASNRQYLTGSNILANGGDTAPTNGTGGVATGLTFTRNTINPLAGVADFFLTKDAASREGMGVSTNFTINNADKGKLFQVSFVYNSASGMTFGANSDLRIWIYDIVNAVLIPITPLYTLVGPTATTVEFTGEFTAATTSIEYRLIFHIGTTSTTAWSINFDEVTVTDVFPVVATEVPSLVLNEQPVSGAVTDHMVVMWRDGATQWVPATIAGATIPVFNTDTTQLGFATSIDGGQADVYIQGALDGFSFGPFTGYDQYIDNTAGGISPLPSPFTDLYCSVGKAISSTVLNIQFAPHIDEISNGSGTPLKGGLLTNSGVNDGTGDQVLTVGTNGQVPVANSAISLGIQWAAPIVATTPFTFTAATRTLTIATATNSVAGVMSAADHALLHNALTIGTANGLSLSTQVLSLAAATDSVTGALTATDHTTYTGYAASIALKANLASPTFTGTPSLPTGTIGVTQAAGNSTTALATTAFVTTADNLKANLASPTFTGTPTLPTGTIGVTQAAGNSTTALATTAFVTTADNLKAPLASPTFTGDVNSSTGNVLISTIGKGLQVKTGTNAKIGTSVLVGGTVTVSNTSVTANSRIFLTSQSDGGTVGFLRVTAKTAATSFVITSSSLLDTSTVAWMIVESIP